MTAQLSREELKQKLIECSQNASGMFEVGEDTMCAMMALIDVVSGDPVAVPDEQHSERFDWTYEDWANHLGGRHQNNDPACYYEFGSFMAVAEMLRQFGNVQRKVGWNACRAAMQSFGNSERLKAEPAIADFRENGNSSTENFRENPETSTSEPVTPRYTLPPHIYRELVNQLRDTAVKYQGCQQLREQISATLRAVVTPAADSSIPTISVGYTLSDGWIKCSEQTPPVNRSVWIYSPTRGVKAMFALAENGKFFYDLQRDDDDIDDATHWMPENAPAAPEHQSDTTVGYVSPREAVRRAHARWSHVTFGNVGPVGPLKHLAKEAIEAAEAPDDLSEWADMQFLLWDAQRRAGISDGEITAAMEEKLKVNMARQWPEPKDGEPRLHIKPEQEV